MYNATCIIQFASAYVQLFGSGIGIYAYFLSISWGAVKQLGGHCQSGGTVVMEMFNLHVWDINHMIPLIKSILSVFI